MKSCGRSGSWEQSGLVDSAGPRRALLGGKEGPWRSRIPDGASANRHAGDPLTGLANRDLLMRTLAELAVRRDGETGVLMIDLDKFKQVNDAAGHEIGDRVLAVAAERMASVLRPGELLARIGGDEFVVVVGDPEAADPRVAVVCADCGTS